jgi:hypothetical protein
MEQAEIDRIAARHRAAHAMRSSKANDAPITHGAPIAFEGVETFERGHDRRVRISVARRQPHGDPSVAIHFQRLDACGAWQSAKTDVRLWAATELAALERAIARVRQIQTEMRATPRE